MNKFLRRIILFPLTLLMGVEGGAATTTDAGAAAATPVAEQGSTQEVTAATTDTTGAVPEAAAAEPQGGEKTEVPAEGEEAAATGGIRQTTFEQRVNELAEKKVKELEQRLTAQQTTAAAEKPDFIELDFGAVNRHLAGLVAREREIQDEIAIDPGNVDPKLLDELFNLQSERDTIRTQVRDNEQRKAAYVQRMEAQQQNAQMMAQINARIVEASEIVRADANIPPDVWKKGEEFFIAERTAKPLIDAKYREMVMIQGPIAALQWAKSYCEEHMGAKEQQVIDQKEAAKQTLPPGKTSTGVVADNANLAAAREKAKSGNAEDIAAYMVEKRKAAAATQ